MKRSLLAAFAALAAAGMVTTAEASYEIPLAGDFSAQGAEGNITIREADTAAYDSEITVEVNGLKPDSVYSVWLAKEEPSRMQGLGVDDYSFKTDASGNGRFVASLSEGELNDWDMIEVAHHPNGDPRDLDNAQIALRADLDTYD